MYIYKTFSYFVLWLSACRIAVAIFLGRVIHYYAIDAGHCFQPIYADFMSVSAINKRKTMKPFGE